jgi:ketosteroid isomerase-like protein
MRKQLALVTLLAAGFGPLQAEPLCASETRLSAEGFVALMERLADAWSRQDTERGIECFTEDAVYMQPPQEQLFRGRAELRKYFGALKPGTTMKFHHLAFDERAQRGFGEFTFGSVGAAKADHGVTVVEVREGKVGSWREYFVEGPAAFPEFIAQDGKRWKWTIENYP